MAYNRKWSKEDEEYLIDNWGTLSVGTIADNLGRTRNAVIVRKERLGLGAFLDSGDYVTLNQLYMALGYGKYCSYYKTSWIRNKKLPVKRKRVNNNSFYVINIDDFWKWADKNRDFIDLSRMEENILGVEPEWVKAKRKEDYRLKHQYKTTQWTKSEDEKLKLLLSKQKYGYDDISRMMNRTCGAIQRRVCDLGIKERPVKADNHNKWSEDEIQKLHELIKDGFGYETLSEHLKGRSSKAIRGMVYRIYKTENIDKARNIIARKDL